MKFSMLHAAREIGVSQSTMHRYIKNGKVSATRLDDGSYEIDPSELFRVFPPGWKKKGSETPAETPSRDSTEPSGTPAETPNETGALRAEVKMLREMLERADLDKERMRREAADAIEDYRRRLDRESEERRGLSIQLLAFNKPPAAPSVDVAPSNGATQRRGFLGLFKKAS